MRTATKLGLLALTCITASGQEVLTKSYDSTRSSSVPYGPTAADVRQRGMVLQTTIPVRGDARGMEAWPLVHKGVMVLPSMADIIRGVNPDTGAEIWETATLCVPVTSTRDNDMWKVNDHFGMMSTGVIDPDLDKLYQVATCSKDGSGSQASVIQRMFVIDTKTGTVLASRNFHGTSNGLDYERIPTKQRSSLALLVDADGAKTVVGLSGSFAETGANASGWLWAFDTYDNDFKAMLATRAGGWLSGQGLSIDPKKTRLLYFGLGNGPFNGTTTFGEAALQVRYTHPTATTPGRFDVLHAWAPFSDAARTCANQQLTQPPAGKMLDATLTGESAPSLVPGANMPMATDCSNAWGDQDANLFGKLLPEGYYLGGGKDGVVWSIPTGAFPSTQPADFGNPKANCAKVQLFQPAWNLGMDSCPTRLADLNRFPGGKTRHIHMTPATYFAKDGKHYEMFMGENSPLQANRVNLDGSLTYVARGAEMASSQSTGEHGGMPGGFCTVGGDTAWCSIPDGDANRTVTNGRLVAYDLTHLQDAVPSLPTIWTSDSYVFNKFMQPLVLSNGKVYLPNYAGSVNVWQLGPVK